MGHKNVCFNCRKSFNIDVPTAMAKESKCPDCGSLLTRLTHRFRPPKKLDKKAWETAKFLVNEGFAYQYIYDDEIIQTYVPYPETMKEAKEFVVKYKEQKKG